MPFHLTPDGPKPCRVDPSNPRSRGCSYGEHYASKVEAQASYERTMGDSLAGQSREPTALELGAQSAAVSRVYSHWSIANGHLHNSSNQVLPEELYYYSSHQGKLELARRLQGERGRPGLYTALTEALENYDPRSFDHGVSIEDLQETIARGREQLNRFEEELQTLEERREPASWRTPELQHYLAEQSHRWISELTPEEQEAVSTMTSSGFMLIQYAQGHRKRETDYIFNSLMDKEAIYEAHGDDYEAAERAIEDEKQRIAQGQLELTRSALRKAPRLDEPIEIVRGTSPSELADIIDPSTPASKGELMDRIEAGAYNGHSASPESRIATIPESASLHLRATNSFSSEDWDDPTAENRRVFLKIKGRTIASPANVGAWGTGELEVYTNPLSSYRITGGRRVGTKVFVLELEEVLEG